MCGVRKDFVMGSFELFCKDMCVEPDMFVNTPQPLEPLRSLYMLYHMAESGIGEGDRVNILATNLNRDVFLWENAELLKVDGPQIVFAPEKKGQCDGDSDVLTLLLDRIVLIQHHVPELDC